MLIIRLLFILIHVYHHLLFDKFEQFVAKMNKFWAKNRVFVPAYGHQVVSSKNNNKKFQLMNFWQLFACIYHFVVKGKLFSN